MADCEFLKECLFFNNKMPIDSALGALFKKNYCQGDSTSCARYKVGKKLGREKVPADLYPIMLERVNEIIAKG